MEQGGDVGETQPEPAPLVRASRDGGTGAGAAIDGQGRREGDERGASDRIGNRSSRACARARRTVRRVHRGRGSSC
jgi:hypothetical protein